MLTASERKTLESYIVDYAEAKYLHQEPKIKSSVKGLLEYLDRITEKGG